MKPKVSVIGAGQVGATTAQRIVEKGLADVVLADIVEGMPQGKSLDLMEAAPLEKHDAKVIGTNDYSEIVGSEIVVVTAGVSRKPGMSRMDLLKTNAQIVKGVAEKVLQYASQSILIMVTNPLDVMTSLVHQITRFPKQRVMGMAGVLDSARFRYFIAEKLKVSVKDVNAMVLGGHGDDMVPLPNYTTVNSTPISKLLSQDELDALITRTRNGGAEIVSLLKQGSAYYAPASSVTQMVKSILLDEREILPCCTLLEGEYGLKGVFCGVPCRLGRKGVLEVVELKLTDEEKKALSKSAESVRQGVQELSSLLSS
ncbi:MAG: malate dehydrogenase [Candidatus Omnitrophica bacterium]|nr:malate dehydrogenase [Candidatus Omnitrophota bacterium]